MKLVNPNNIVQKYCYIITIDKIFLDDGNVLSPSTDFDKLIIQRISLMMFECSIGVLPSPVSALLQYKSVIHTQLNHRRNKFIYTI